MQSQPALAYMRTAAGQSACLTDFPLPRPSRQLLLLVNGFTPLDHLAERIALDEPQSAIDSLVANGLIAPVTQAPGRR